MSSFESLGHLATHFAELAVTEVVALHEGLEKCAVLVEKTAKGEIGMYQPQAGPFQDWAELAESTKEDRVNRGFSENDPLLRTGGLRDSITHEVNSLEAVIGSTDPVMIYQEFGTPTSPPRAVLGPAAFRNKEKIKAIIGAAAMAGYFGGEKIHESLGYDMETP